MALSQPVTQIVCSITYIFTKSNWINAYPLAKLVKKSAETFTDAGSGYQARIQPLPCIPQVGAAIFALLCDIHKHLHPFYKTCT
jgi:hypothetical protein